MSNTLFCKQKDQQGIPKLDIKRLVDEKEFKSFDPALHELKQKVILNAGLTLTNEIKIDYLNTNKTKYGFSTAPGESFYVEVKIR